MIHLHAILAVVAAFVAGFGVGRIKNAGKLSAIAAEIKKIETAVDNDVKSVIAKIKAKL